ncbi:unnamed protein product [Rotaria sp. Silwood1]|nr:unnamed protein product [Rotaria sp. Silwood1]CAF4679191.1 unnamed protein product [Rotaria sp. Silwood1]
MHRVVCAVNESLYYQMLCKGLLMSLLKYESMPYKITVLLDGKHSEPLDDLRKHIEIISVKPLDIICGSVSSRTTFARLEIPYVFPYERRILYLDVDTYIMNDIHELFTMPFETIAAVVPGTHLMIKDLITREFKTKLNTMYYELDGIRYSVGSEDHKYFNAGVMLMDSYKWRQFRIKQHVEALINAHPLAMYTSDEMALNLIFRGRLTDLRQCYNTFSFTARDLTEIPRIWHFNTDTKRIQGAILIGSFGRGEGSPASDIDIELLILEDQLDIDEFTNHLIQLFKKTEESLVIKHTIWLADRRKLALYHGPQLLLTELYLYTQLSQFDKYFLGSRITDLTKCILVDRQDLIRQHLEYILTLPYDNRDGLIRELIASILYQLESTSSARRRCDAYKFYFLSNITLHELVRLAYVLNGKMEYNYNPPQSIVNPDLSSTMNLDKSGLHLKNLINLFLEQLDRIENIEAFWNDFPTGRLDKAGFVKYYEEIKDDKDKTSVLCDHVFAIFDKNHDGTIDFNEFLLAVAVSAPHDIDSHLDYVFEMCDVSGDGRVDVNELAAFLSASLTIVGRTDQKDHLDPKKLAASIFNTLGIDEDKKLTKEEFIKGYI